MTPAPALGVAEDPSSGPADAPGGPKPRPPEWEDDEIYLHDLLTAAVRAVDPAVEADELDLFCATDFTRCRVRAPLLDEALDEDALWDIARAAVLDAASGDAALTSARTLDPDDALPMMELEITLVVE